MKVISKKQKKKLTKSQFQWKVIKIILIAYLIVMVFNIFLNRYLDNNKSIYEKIGYMSPYSVTMKEALTIEAYGLTQYANFIESGDTKSAYNMFTEEYKNVVGYEEYLKDIENIDFSTFDMKQLKMKAEGTYVATVEYEKSGEEVEEIYMLYSNEINPNLITISPDKFIYRFSDLEFKMDKIKLTLEKCDVYTDNVNIKVLIENTSLFETITLTNLGIGYEETANKEKDIECTLKPGETKEIELNYETNYYVPDNIKLKRLMNEDTIRTYTFYFEKAK